MLSHRILIMSTPFESVFLKAAQLLHSPEKDATEQLKSMLDECLAQKKTPATSAVPPKPSTTIKPVIINKTLAAPTPVTVAPPAPILLDNDMDMTGSHCIVCKQVDQRVGNEIVECQECHGLYHQECHNPSLANENVKDPRFIWYCSTCTSKRKKVKMTTKPPVSTSGHGSVNKETKEQQNPEVSPFKSWSFVKK